MKRSSAALVVVVAGSLLLIAILTVAGPKPQVEKKGAAEVTVVIDFGGQRPAHPYGNSTVVWWKDGSVDPSPGPALWSIWLKMDNATVYSALEAASKRADFSFNADWYPNFRSHRVSEIAGVRDGSDNRYWQYYVNGQYLDKGADLVGLSDGDTVRWEFKAAQQ